MKKIMLQCMNPVFGALLLISCGSDKKDIQDDLKKDAKNALQKDAPKTVDNVVASGEVENVTNVAGAKKFIAANSNNKGKGVSLSAYPRAMSKVKDGEFMLYLSDKTGTGLPEENFAAVFKEAMLDQVRANKAGRLVKVTGNVAYAGGMVQLKDAKISE